MSAPESPGARFGSCAADVVELAALRGRATALELRAAARGLPLAPAGGLRPAGGRLTLNVRPERWLLLGPQAPPGASAAEWDAAAAGVAAATDLSGALKAFVLAGAAAAEVLSRGCRLDLEPRVFPAGRAAATIMCQVPVILAVLPAAYLLLTPSSTARHFEEWLATAARPFGLMRQPGVTIATLLGEQTS